MLADEVEPEDRLEELEVVFEFGGDHSGPQQLVVFQGDHEQAGLTGGFGFEGGVVVEEGGFSSEDGGGGAGVFVVLVVEFGSAHQDEVDVGRDCCDVFPWLKDLYFAHQQQYFGQEGVQLTEGLLVVLHLLHQLLGHYLLQLLVL